jgi:uncharacterized delta-60 repeat protein
VLVVAAPAPSSRSRVGAPTRASFNPSAASIDVGRALVVQRDGTIVVAGLSRRGGRYDFALARYKANGRLDSSFGSSGLVLTPFGRGGFGAYAVGEQSARKLVAAGGAYAAENQSAFAVARYTRAGTLDPAFGSGGKVMTAFATPRGDRLALALAAGIALQRDGKTVVAGWATDAADETQVALARYTGRGALDRRFGTRGKTATVLGSGEAAAARAVALQRDGRIVIAGWSDVPALEQSHFLVARFTRGGRIDRSFGTRGSTVTPLGFSGSAADVVIQPDGRIVVAGSVHVARDGIQLGLARYLPNGRIDPSFGTNGTVLTNFAVDDEPALALQPDGKLVAACGLSSPRRFGLARYTRDGRLDPTFGEGGRVRTRFPESSVARDVAIEADGKILVAGSTGGDFAVARYTGDGRLDVSFGTDGLVRTPLGTAWLREPGR